MRGIIKLKILLFHAGRYIGMHTHTYIYIYNSNSVLYYMMVEAPKKKRNCIKNIIKAKLSKVIITRVE